MTGSRKRSTTLAVAVAGLVALTGGLANATSTNLTYRGAWSPMFGTQASCDASSAARNDPPDLLSYSCSYYPDSGPDGGLAGWYYYYKYLID